MRINRERDALPTGKCIKVVGRIKAVGFFEPCALQYIVHVRIIQKMYCSNLTSAPSTEELLLPSPGLVVISAFNELKVTAYEL